MTGTDKGQRYLLYVIMIVMNGLIGVSLLVGGMRYHEQFYNFFGANAFLAVIVPLAVLALKRSNLGVINDHEHEIRM